MSRHELRLRELTSSTAALFALFVGAFSVGMAEFVIAGILPQLAEALRVGAGAAGLPVTVYALGVAVGGPLLTAAARRLSRKAVLIRSMIIFITASVVSSDGPRPRPLLLACQHLRCRHVGQRLRLIEIKASAEATPGAVEDQHACFWVRIDCPLQNPEFIEHFEGDRIQPLGAGKGRQHDPGPRRADHDGAVVV